jgi:predicted secreted protein
MFSGLFAYTRKNRQHVDVTAALNPDKPKSFKQVRIVMRTTRARC